MNRTTIIAGSLFMAAGITVLGFGCDDNRDHAAREAREAQRTSEDLAREAARNTRESAEAAQRAAQEAARAMQQPLREVVNPAPGQPVPGRTTTLAFTDALGNIAAARCERENRCNHIGAGKRYATAEACQTAIREDLKDDLNPRDCTAGIDRAELTECMSEIRGEDCNSPIDTLSRVIACRTTDLCRSTASLEVPTN